MSSVALIIAAIVLVPVVVGAITGAVMNPGGWKQTLNAAAVGSGIVAGLVVVAIVAAMIAHPTECTGSNCHETDTSAAVQIVFVAPLLVPIYALVLPGTALGKLVGQGLRKLAGQLHAGQGPRGE